MDHLYAVGDPVFGRDLWIVIELPSDDRGRRTRLGRQVRHVTDDVPYAAFSEGFLKFFISQLRTRCNATYLLQK